MRRKEAEIEEAEAELAASKEDERRQYESMKLRIQYMYEKGETSYLDLLFKSADLTQLFNRAEYISQIAAYDRKMLDQYEAASEEVAAREADLKAEHEELVALKTNTEEKQKDAERLMNEKTAELKSYNSKIAASEGSLSDLEKDIAAQEDKIKAIEAELKRKEEEAKKAALEAGKKYNTVSIGNINFIWPCPASSRITSSFGDRESPTEGASSSHQGIDIGASHGQQHSGGGFRYRNHIYIQLFCRQLYHDQSWRRCLHRLHALFGTSRFCRAGGDTGAGNC